MRRVVGAALDSGEVALDVERMVHRDPGSRVSKRPVLTQRDVVHGEGVLPVHREPRIPLELQDVLRVDRDGDVRAAVQHQLLAGGWLRDGQRHHLAEVRPVPAAPVAWVADEGGLLADDERREHVRAGADRVGLQPGVPEVVLPGGMAGRRGGAGDVEAVFLGQLLIEERPSRAELEPDRVRARDHDLLGRVGDVPQVADPAGQIDGPRDRRLHCGGVAGRPVRELNPRPERAQPSVVARLCGEARRELRHRPERGGPGQPDKGVIYGREAERPVQVGGRVEVLDRGIDRDDQRAGVPAAQRRRRDAHGARRARLTAGARSQRGRHGSTRHGRRRSQQPSPGYRMPAGQAVDGRRHLTGRQAIWAGHGILRPGELLNCIQNLNQSIGRGASMRQGSWVGRVRNAQAEHGRRHWQVRPWSGRSTLR